MKFREHRCTLEDSLATTVELPDDLDALHDHLIKRYSCMGNVTNVELEYSCFDARIDWDTWLVNVTLTTGKTFVAGMIDTDLVTVTK